MTEQTDDTTQFIYADPDGRSPDLAMLVDLQVDLKARAAELKDQLDAVTNKIKTEMIKAGGDSIVLQTPTHRLALTRVETWRLDSKRIKTDMPEIYAAYAKRSESWTLREVTDRRSNDRTE